MGSNIIKEKSFEFAVQIVKLSQYLASEKKEFVLSRQILRSGTSVGAMIREGEHAQSKADFVHKLSIAQNEINETLYLLELLKATDYISVEKFSNLNHAAIEIIKLLTSIIKTAKSNLNN